MKKIVCLALICATALALCACGGASGLKQAYDTLCADWPEDSIISAESAAELGGDNSYLRIDTNPYDFDDYSSPEALTAIQNTNELLGFPDHVYESMMSTRAMDGRQTYDGDRYNVAWTFHPDSGLDAMYTTK